MLLNSEMLEFEIEEPMTKRIKRRDFMRTSAVAGLTLAGTKASVLQFPNIMVPADVKPIVISSANGIGSRMAAT